MVPAYFQAMNKIFLIPLEIRSKRSEKPGSQGPEAPAFATERSDGGKRRPEAEATKWWTLEDLNLRLPPCEGGTRYFYKHLNEQRFS